MPRKTNPFGKSVSRDNPYAVYQAGPITYSVLKTYKHPDNEQKDDYARWQVLGVSPMVGPMGEIGDMYARDIRATGVLVQATDAWREHYA